jgi:hypothetical protein
MSLSLNNSKLVHSRLEHDIVAEDDTEMLHGMLAMVLMDGNSRHMEIR